MDFSLSAEQQDLVDAAGRFSADRLAPSYALREREEALDRQTLRDMGRLGFFGIELSEKYGGLGLDRVTAGLVLEALCADDMNIGYVTVNMSLIGQILSTYGRPEAVDDWLKGMIAGDLIPSIALTEPAGGSDAGNLALQAPRDGQHYVLTGEKTSISLATQADFCVVFARTGARGSGPGGISAFLVPLDLPGISKTAFKDHGNRSVGRGSLFFDGVRVPARNLLGEENRAFAQVMQGFDYSRALLGIQCLTVARRSIEETWAHSKERQAFGKPLSAFQGVSFPLAEADTMVSAARLLCLQTLWLKDQGLPHTAEAAMCKWWGPKVAYDAINTCLLLHGHAGYSQDLPFEQRMRDVLGLQIGDGTAQIMKLVIARQRAGRSFVPN
jgi:cyclohexanecarboxyl-CoA dehydrogenase